MWYSGLTTNQKAVWQAASISFDSRRVTSAKREGRPAPIVRDILRSLAILAVLVPALAGSAHSATLRVPGEYATIQAGIDAASAGDTVLVAPGTYTECDGGPCLGAVLKLREGCRSSRGRTGRHVPARHRAPGCGH